MLSNIHCPIFLILIACPLLLAGSSDAPRDTGRPARSCGSSASLERGLSERAEARVSRVSYRDGRHHHHRHHHRHQSDDSQGALYSSWSQDNDAAAAAELETKRAYKTKSHSKKYHHSEKKADKKELKKSTNSTSSFSNSTTTTTTSRISNYDKIKTRRALRSVKSVGGGADGASQRVSPRHFSSKLLVGSPYETKSQASFLTSSSVKAGSAGGGRQPSLLVHQIE